MAKKHKHEEHQNLEAWVISYADMVTLLFALFVVLYAIGETKLAKLKDLKQSLQFAFSFDGNGKTKEPGIHDKGQEGRGDVLQAAQILNAQDKSMRQFLQETLPDSFLEASGHSLEIIQTDDTISFIAPLSAYFSAGENSPLRSSDLTNVLGDLVSESSGFTDSVRIRIECPNVVIGRDDRTKVYVRSNRLCLQRLEFLADFIANVRNVDPHQILSEFQFEPGQHPPDSRAAAGWEDRARLVIAFSNGPTGQ